MVTLNEKIYLDNLFLDLSVNTTAEMMKSRLEGAMGPSVGSITVSTTGTCHGQSWHLTFKTVGGDILPLEVMCSLTPVFLLIRMKAGANQANIKWRQRFFCLKCHLVVEKNPQCWQHWSTLLDIFTSCFAFAIQPKFMDKNYFQFLKHNKSHQRLKF